MNHRVSLGAGAVQRRLQGVTAIAEVTLGEVGITQGGEYPACFLPSSLGFGQLRPGGIKQPDSPAKIPEIV